MSEFRYQAVADNGASVAGVIEADDRKSALQLLGQRGLFPSLLELHRAAGVAPAETSKQSELPAGRRSHAGGRIKRKDITALTREISALLGAAIPIPQALDSLGEEEENPALKAVILKLADSVRKGAALSAALEEHPKLFGKLYSSMVRVGEEGGVLPKVMADLATLLEHEDEVRGEVNVRGGLSGVRFDFRHLHRDGFADGRVAEIVHDVAGHAAGVAVAHFDFAESEPRTASVLAVAVDRAWRRHFFARAGIFARRAARRTGTKSSCACR